MAPSHPETSKLYHPQSKVQAPVKIRWPKVFYKPQVRHDVCGVDYELIKDSPKESHLSRSWLAEDSILIEAENRPIADASYDYEQAGSYPSNPEYRLFSNALKVLSGCGLDILEEDEGAKSQPEKDLEELGKATSIRKTTFAFPLDLFHNPELELCHPRLDIEEAHQRHERGVLARSRFYSSNGECSWEPCLVLSYDEDRMDFLIEWVKSGKRKSVKRLNLILEREEESNFIAKVIDARHLRRLVEAQMRCSEYVEGLPFENPDIFNAAWKVRLENLAGISLSKRYLDLVNNYLESFKVEYRRIVKKSILDHKYYVSKEDFSRLKALQIFYREQRKPTVPRQGCLPLEFEFEKSFSETNKQISRTLCVAEEAFLLGLLRFYKEMDITDVCLFNPLLFTLPRPLRLEDFRLVQEDYLKEVADNFRNDWVPRVVAMIDELAPPTTEFSGAALEKLRGFVHRLSLIMTQQLLDVVFQSIAKYKRLWEQYTKLEQNAVIDLEMDAKKTTTKEGGKPILGVMTDNLHLMPMFKIKLKVEGDHFLFDPSLALIGSTVLLLLDSILLAVKGIEDLQSRVTTISTIYEFKEMKSLQNEDLRFLTVRKSIEVPGLLLLLA
ncbi:hypothetical protein L7F22_011421 [Adiantum nelumboides]|nr:hypothetical protein [Adiantum nelumboides]